MKTKEDINIAIEKAVEELIRKPSFGIAFTGAGMSVESGLFTYRGKNGLWSKTDPDKGTYDYFLDHPFEVWEMWKDRFYGSAMINAKPNKGHDILAKWENKGIIKSVITQNIDNLHKEAGSKEIYELHGNVKKLHCDECKYQISFNNNIIEQPIPYCPKCKDGIFRPDITMFGEMLPQKVWNEASKIIHYAYTMIIIGTTGKIYPAASLPQKAAQRGVKIIEINPTPSEYTNTLTDIFIPYGAVEGLSRIDKLL